MEDHACAQCPINGRESLPPTCSSSERGRESPHTPSLWHLPATSTRWPCWNQVTEREYRDEELWGLVRNWRNSLFYSGKVGATAGWGLKID